MEGTLVIAGYVRSSDPSKKDSEMLNAQKEALRTYACEQYHTDIPDSLMYEDAISALRFPYWERGGLMQAWDGAENKWFDKLLVTEFFRIARKSSEQYAVIEYFKRCGVEVISITERFEETTEGRLLYAAQGFLGEIEAEKTHIRIARGKRHRQSLVLTGQGPRTYGLTYVDTKEFTNAYYVPNTEVIAVIEGKPWTEVDVLAFERKLCLSGVSTNQIAKLLTKIGIPTQTGKNVWNRTTIVQHLTNGNYRGYPYAVNNRWVREGHKSSIKRANNEEVIPLPEGIYPRLVDPEEFDAIQEQLRRNRETVASNNKVPNETLLRALVYCGICGNRMHVGHHKKAYGQHTQIQRSEYQCRRNQGVEDVLRHHCVSIAVHLLDEASWKFALSVIREPGFIRSYIAEFLGKGTNSNHINTLEDALNDVTQRTINLMAVAETAQDELTRQLYQERLAALEKERREAESLLHRFSNNAEREERLQKALEKFEAWASTQREFLEDSVPISTQEDKRAALVILGVKATVFPATGYPNRMKFELMPPNTKRFCDADFIKAVYYIAGEGGE